MTAPQIHPSAVCETNDIGAGVVIGSHASIEKGARIGNGVVIKNGVHIYSGMVVEDGVHIGPNASFASERLPFNGAPTDKPIILREGCVIGANATLCPGITIGARAIIDAGAVVTQSGQCTATSRETG